jgi:ribonucleoside-diphosphate reductase alpha chain
MLRISNNNNINNYFNPSKWPSLPKNHKKICLSENSRIIMEKRYIRKDSNGNLCETHEEALWRVSYNVWNGGNNTKDKNLPHEYYNMLAGKEFFPNSPTFTGAGTPLGQLAACFVLPIDDDMGKEENGIFNTLRNASLIQQSGGGNGFSFSKLREKGALVGSSGGVSSGPLGFLEVYDKAFGTVAQGGTRRGANMAVLRVDHPDIRDFITCKKNEHSITNFNISVGVTDEFMEAVENGDTFDLKSPKNGKITDTVDARELFNLIAEYAYNNGEPGMLFLDTANRYNPVPHLYELEATNPCGEQWLGPYENCCLGSVNLSLMDNGKGGVDWNKLASTVMLGTNFLDDVVTANKYIPSVPQLKKAAEQCRRIGLGMMGFSDLCIKCNIRYGSKKAIDFAGQISEFIRYHSMKQSILLAKELGPFKAIEGSIYDKKNFRWEIPKPLEEYKHDFDRPELDWPGLVVDLKEYGIRNAAQTTVPPTGTIGSVVECEGYGCEPIFAYAYSRNIVDGDKKLTLNYASKLFNEALDKEKNISIEKKQEIIDRVLENGTCQDILSLPSNIRDIFVNTNDISVESHVKMQAAFQAFIDNSLSKTVNCPSTTTIEDIKNIYIMAWKLGCKGVTVYVTGSRNIVVLETKKTKDSKSNNNNNNNNIERTDIDEYGRLKRPKVLNGKTLSVNSGYGKMYVTLNKLKNGDPFEIFVSGAKPGSEYQALGRLSSFILRMDQIKSPYKKINGIIKQLKDIKGSQHHGFGNKRTYSIADVFAKGLKGHLLEEENDDNIRLLSDSIRFDSDEENNMESSNYNNKRHNTKNMCPECGNYTLYKSENCVKCTNPYCAYQLCG